MLLDPSKGPYIDTGTRLLSHRGGLKPLFTLRLLSAQSIMEFTITELAAGLDLAGALAECPELRLHACLLMPEKISRNRPGQVLLGVC